MGFPDTCNEARHMYNDLHFFSTLPSKKKKNQNPIRGSLCPETFPSYPYTLKTCIITTYNFTELHFARVKPVFQRELIIERGNLISFSKYVIKLVYKRRILNIMYMNLVFRLDV